MLVFQHFDEPSCNVLLFINLSPEELSGSFYLKTETEENESHLFKEGNETPGDLGKDMIPRSIRFFTPKNIC